MICWMLRYDLGEHRLAAERRVPRPHLRQGDGEIAHQVVQHRDRCNLQALFGRGAERVASVLKRKCGSDLGLRST